MVEAAEEADKDAATVSDFARHKPQVRCSEVSLGRGQRGAGRGEGRGCWVLRQRRRLIRLHRLSAGLRGTRYR